MLNTAQLVQNTFGIATANSGIFGQTSGTLQVLSSQGKPFSSATIRLAVSMMEHHAALGGLLTELRRAACAPGREFRYSTEELTPQAREQVFSHCESMMGLLSHLYCNRTTSMVSGKVADVPSCINFLNGGYLELAIEDITRREVERFCQERNLSHQILRNVLVTDGQVKNELDILIDIEGVKMFIEVKSGNCTDFEKYYFIGRRYGLIPDRILLVSAQLTDDRCQQLHDFLEYYTANLDSYIIRLNEMLNKNFGGI